MALLSTRQGLSVTGHPGFAVRHAGLAPPTLRPGFAAGRGASVATTRAAHDAFVAAALRWTIMLLPINWACGTTPFWCYGVAILVLFRSRSFGLLETLFLWLIAALTVGLVIGVGRGAPLDRAFASVYNITILIVLIAFLNGAVRLGTPAMDGSRHTLYRAALIVFVINTALVAAVYGVTKATGDYDITFRSAVLGLGMPLPGVFGDYGKLDLAITDWTVSGPENRVIGFGIYATEGALLFLLMGLLGEISEFAARRYWRVLLIEGTVAVGLVLMASRTTLGAYLMSALLLAAMLRGRLVKLALIAAPVILVGALVIALYGYDAIGQWLIARNQERLGSSDTRFLSYMTGAAMVMAQNPLTGLGVKPVDLSLMEIPIGSHSTLSSMLTKGGFIALGITVVIFVVMLAGIVRSQIAIWLAAARRLDTVRQFELIQLARCVLVILLWWTTEDLDAPAHEASIAGLCLGLFWSLTRRAARSKN